MENQDIYNEESIAKAKKSAGEMMYQGGKSLEYVIAKLETRGYDNITAIRIAQSAIVKEVPEDYVVVNKHDYKDQVVQDIFMGALWFFVGFVLTMSKTGYIFWGAIVFGALQFLRGLFNAFT